MIQATSFVELIERQAPERRAAGEAPAEQRLLDVLAGRSTDILPFCLPGFNLFDWADPSYATLLPALARHTDPIHEVAWGYNPIAGLVTEPGAGERLSNGDLLRRIATPLGDLTEVSRPAANKDGSTSHARVRSWVQSADDVRRFLSLPWQPTQRDTSAFQAMRARLGNRALSIISLQEPLQSIDDLMGTEALCLLSATEPVLLQSLVDALFERIMEELNYLLARDLGAVIRVAGAEMAIPPLMSLKGYERYAFPYERKMADAIHAKGLRMLLHCHGNINRLLVRFADAGADGVDPCEPPPIGGTDLTEAKRQVGGRLSLWGNLEYDVLSEAGEPEARELTRRTIEAGAPGGGFVLLPCCRLYESPLPERTLHNLLAVIEVATEYRKV